MVTAEALDQRAADFYPSLITELSELITNSRTGKVEPFDPAVYIKSSQESSRGLSVTRTFDLNWSTPQLVDRGLTDPESEATLNLLLTDGQVRQFRYFASFKHNRDRRFATNAILIDGIYRFNFFKDPSVINGQGLIIFEIDLESERGDERPLRQRLSIDPVSIYTRDYTGG